MIGVGGVICAGGIGRAPVLWEADPNEYIGAPVVPELPCEPGEVRGQVDY